LSVDRMQIVNLRLDFKYDIENIHRYIKSTRVSYSGAKIKRCLTRRQRKKEHQLFK
jgi:hypothetical protein